MNFVKQLIDNAKKYQIEIDCQKAVKLEKFAEFLTEENKLYNLTKITQPENIISKHFIDSLAGLQFIKDKKKIVDIGSGAGFPSIPLKIVEGGEYLLLDSLNKRVGFLNKAIELLELKNMKAVHARIEDAANLEENRHNFDIVVARAVAPLNILIEYAMPFLKKGGKLIAYKGKGAKEEIELAKNAMKIMKAEIEEIFPYTIEGGQRYILSIKSKSEEHKGYPRAQNKPRKQPL